MKKDGIQTRNRKLASKGKKKRGSVVDFFSPFVNATSDRLPFAAYNNISSSSNSHYGGLPGHGTGSGGSYSRYGDLTNTAAMSQYYSGMAGQMTSQFMVAAAQQAATSHNNTPSMHNNGNMYSSVGVGGSGGMDTSNINDHTSSPTLPTTLGCSGVILGGTQSTSSAAAAAAAAASFAAFGPSSLSMQAAAAASVGATLT